MTIHSYILDLGDYLTPGSKVFTGRDRGKEVREASGIDRIEPANEKILIRIPENVRSLNPSFLEEFLKNVVERLGPAKFQEKFSWESGGAYNHDDDFKRAIFRIARLSNALMKIN